MVKTVKIKNVTFKAPKKKNKEYDTKEMMRGRKVEGEHTKNKKVKDIIVKNHLDEDKKYYSDMGKKDKRIGSKRKRK